MNKFSLKNISSAENENLSQGVFIILFNASSTPPHLLLSVFGRVYSITDSGRQMGSSLEKLILFVKRKKVPSLFVEWDFSSNYSPVSEGRMETIVKNIFGKYERVVEGKVSCLFPIRDVVAAVLGDEMNAANFIFELLPLMENKNAIGKSYSFNLEIENGKFELLTYDNSQLQTALQSTKVFKSE